MSIFTKILGGDPNEKVINNLKSIVKEINDLEPEFEKLKDEDLKLKTEEFKEGIKNGKTLDDFLVPGFALVREAVKRVLNQRQFDVQLMGGIILNRGEIAEMKTGEGKTSVATLPLYLNALSGQGSHLITVNDYLARIGAGWMGPVYHLLGLSTGVIMHDQAFVYDPEYVDETADDERLKHFKPVERREAYTADITYGTNNEFGFDYLRDNMVQNLEDKVQREFNFCIVDEVDSILIDEARTPLIISAPAEESAKEYYKFADLVKRLKENDSSSGQPKADGVGQGDYNIDEKMRAATLTEAGIGKMEKWLGVDNIYTESGINTVHHIEQALRAQTLFKRDRDYVVREGQVVIVDEFTGRMMPGRRYSEGLHQAIEAKEAVNIQRESRTMATITFQNLFRIYKKLSGMTGTALTEAEEFHKIYGLDVTVIPTNKPNVRDDSPDKIYKTEDGKFKAIVEEVKERNAKGQPVLIGTISVAKNELLGQLLEREGIRCEFLNAKNHEKEASIISEAGKRGAVTVATNMAGRGVDILLGGSEDPAEHKKVLELGGLHVIGSERHESRRIDNQLRGRAGRQGDPGSSQFFISMEDDLMRIFAGDRLKSIMERLKLPEDMPIENKMVSRSIESAQKKVEGHNFDIRKHLVEYDDVINKHREVVYRKREEILKVASQRSEIRDQRLENDDEQPATLKEMILEMVENEIEQVVMFHTSAEPDGDLNLKEIVEVMSTIFPIGKDLLKQIEKLQKGEGRLKEAEWRTKIIERLSETARQNYEELEKKIAESSASLAEAAAEAGAKAGLMQRVEKSILLRSMDTLWMEHLSAIDHLRTGIGLRGYAQRDPLIEYKKEAYRLFNELMSLIQRQVVYSIFKIGLEKGAGPLLVPQQNLQFSAPAKTMESSSSHMAQMAGELSQSGAPSSAPPEAGGSGPDGKSQEAKIPKKLRDESGKKVSRNDPCPCGSGKKYKKCHGA